MHTYRYATSVKVLGHTIPDAIVFCDRNRDEYVWLLGTYIYRDTDKVTLPVRYYPITGNAVIPETFGDPDFRLVRLAPLPSAEPVIESD